MDVYLGLDIGTTNIKMILADGEGKVIESRSSPLGISAPGHGWAEQDPEDWWTGVTELLSSVPGKVRVAGIGLSGQMHTLVPVDREGRVLRKAILWCDQRTAAECAEAEALLGGESRVVEMTGNLIYPGFTLPKILWIRKHEPEIYRKITTCYIAKDYIGWRLTGERATEWSDASGSACWDVSARKWRSDLLSALGVDEGWLPPVKGSAEIRGILRPELARRFGWGETKVICGGADNAVSAFGLGVASPGDCMISIGTSGTVLAITGSTAPDPTGRLHFFNSVLPGQSYYMGCMLAAAASLNWFRDVAGRDLTWDDIGKAVEETPPGAGGMLWLPYLNGERTPHRNPNARGVLYGLSSMSDRRHVFRAVMEGITYGLRDSFELVRAATPVKRVIMAGGGAKSAVWRKMTASVMGFPVSVPETEEGGAYGAAMLAALGGGLSPDDVRGWTRILETVEPDDAEKKAYDRGYLQFQALYRDLRERFDATAHNTGEQ